MTEHLLTEPMPMPTEGEAALLSWAQRNRDDNPVCYDETFGMWHLFRHADAHRMFSDYKTFAANFGDNESDGNAFGRGNLTQMDPPELTARRQLVSQAFSRKTVAELAPRVTEITTSLLDAARGKERFDLVEDVAYPLPVTVIAEMIGVPASDKELFRVWADGIFDPNVNADADNDADTIKARVKPMQDYFHEHVGDRRRTPRGDLITGLTQAEVDGDRLDDEEIVTFLTILLIAGHITTTLMLGNTVRCLHERPDIAARLRADRDLIPAAIEESLRLRPPFTFAARMAAEDVEVTGVTIPKGSAVTAWLVSANHDPRAFPSADEFVLDRFVPGQNASPHYAFGHGAHFCVGAPLARLEGKIAMGLLLDRYAEIALDPDDPFEFFANPGTNGAKRLPVVVRPA